MHGIKTPDKTRSPLSTMFRGMKQRWAMKVQYTFITRTFRGMVVFSRSIPALSKSLGQTQPITFHRTSAFGPINPNIFAYSTSAWERGKQALKRVVDGGSEYNIVLEREFRKTVPSVNAKRVIEGSRENAHDESSKAFPKVTRPRPQQVRWRQREVENTVHLIGVLVNPLRFHFIPPRYGHAWGELEVENSHEDVPGVNNSHEDEPLRFELDIWGGLAEVAVKNLNQNDRVYVSGPLTSKPFAENDKRCILYKVIVKRLSLAPGIYPGSSQLVVANTDVRSLDVPKKVVIRTDAQHPAVSKQVVEIQNTVRNGVQYQQSRFLSSNSGNKTGETAAIIESLWLAVFTNPDDWWDNRARKDSQNCPDFTHKVTNNGLWISSSPSWVKSELAVRDSRMKDPEE